MKVYQKKTFFNVQSYFNLFSYIRFVLSYSKVLPQKEHIKKEWLILQLIKRSDKMGLKVWNYDTSFTRILYISSSYFEILVCLGYQNMYQQVITIILISDFLWFLGPLLGLFYNWWVNNDSQIVEEMWVSHGVTRKGLWRGTITGRSRIMKCYSFTFSTEDTRQVGSRLVPTGSSVHV